MAILSPDMEYQGLDSGNLSISAYDAVDIKVKTWTWTYETISCTVTTSTAEVTWQICGPNNDVTSFSTDLHTYVEETGWQNGTTTYTFTTEPDYFFEDGATTMTITLTDDPSVCHRYTQCRCHLPK